MNPIERAKSIEKIKSSRSTTIILISFKAGGTGRNVISVQDQSSVSITGLNLVECNNVILTDLWWNPALEVRSIRPFRNTKCLPSPQDQAFDRAHRMGQVRDVNIYKLTIERTVEDRILEVRGSSTSASCKSLIRLQLQQKKRELAAAALSGAKLKTKGLGVDELLNLFKHGSKDSDDED